MINTIIGITYAILNNDLLATNRLGTHDCELFFAHLRLFSYYDNTYENAIKSIVRSIIIRKYSTDLNYPIYIDKRENNAEEINERDDMLIDVNFICQTVFFF